MGASYGHGPDPRWAFAAAKLRAKAAHLAAHAAHAAHAGHWTHGHGHEHGHDHGRGPRWAGECDPRAEDGMTEDFGGFFGGGPGPHGPPGGPWGGPWGRGRAPWAKGPGGRGARARKGNVRAAILALLAEEPRNGYQIIQEIEERSGGGWKPSPGAVYPALQQLADEGLVRGEEGGGRRVFHLTDEGRAYVDEHADELAEPWARMTPDFGEGVPELFRQAARTGAALMQVVHSGSPEQVARAKEVLEETRRRLYLILAEDDTAATGTGTASADGAGATGGGADADAGPTTRDTPEE